MRHEVSEAAIEGWRQRLHALFQSRMRIPFAWGINDCVLFAAAAVQAQTGIDYAASWRGAYSDAAGAARILAQQGGLEALASRVGDGIPPLCAHLGDIGLVLHEGRELLAVCSGPNWLAPGPNGLAPMSLVVARRAWRVARA